MKMYMLVDIILTRKFVDKETGATTYQGSFNNTKMVKAEDGVEVALPETGKIKLSQSLPRGRHLLLVRVYLYQNTIRYEGLEEVKDPKIIQALAGEK